MATPYTATSNISALKLKGWVSTATSLSDAQLLELLNDSLRSYIVPFTKRVRDEWFVSGGSTLTPNSNGRLRIPNSVGSTVRTVSWVNNGIYVPLSRIEPENALPLLRQGGGGQPVGYTLKGYELQIVPINVGSIQVFIEFMERPPAMVLEEDAALVSSNVGLVLTLESVPLAWQESAPTAVNVISGESPFSPLAEDVEVVSLVGSTLTLTGIDSSLIEPDCWVSDVSTSPFPNIPIELHPLMQQSVISTLYAGLGDKRLQGAMDLQAKLEADLRATIAPRTQGSARPIINKNGPGWGIGRWGRGSF